MTRTRLIGKDGAVVAEVDVPALSEEPEVLFVGVRVFVKTPETPGGIAVFREVFGYAMPDPPPAASTPEEQPT